MNPYQQQGHSGYPQPPYLHNTGFNNAAPQSFGNPMPMPGFPTAGYPVPQTGYPNPSGYPQPGPQTPQHSQSYPQATQGYPNSAQNYPTSAQRHPTPAQNYPLPAQSHPAPAQGYPTQSYSQNPQTGYPQQSAGYPQANQGYQPPSQGYQQHSAPHVQRQQYAHGVQSSGPAPVTPKGHSGYPQPPYLHNTGFNNAAPQSFGNPMPMPGFPTAGYPVPQTGYPNPSGYPQPGPQTPQHSQSYPQATQGYPNSAQNYPTSAQRHPTPAQNYPLPAQSHPAPAQGYPTQSYSQNPQTGYPQQSAGYPQANQGYQPPSQGYQQHSAPHVQRQQYAHGVQSSGPAPVTPKCKPTVVPANPFDPREDAAVLRKAMKGFGTDEKAIIHVLTRRSNEQRLRIAFEFKTLYGKDLISDLKSETSGKFEDLVVALMTPLPQFYAKELHDAIAGIGTDEDVLIEVMCTMSNHEIQVIKQSYTAIYGTLLEDALRGDTSGNFKRLMTSLCMGNRSEEFHVDVARAREDARSLLQAGELRLGTDESIFNAVLCSRSFPQLAAIFQEYQGLTGHDIDDAIKAEFSGDMEKALRAIVKVVRNKPLFFAERLHKSMKGLGTNDRQLIRVMVTRCEVDLGDIADMFNAKYGETLQSWIEGDCSGHYKKCLLGLLGLY